MNAPIPMRYAPRSFPCSAGDVWETVPVVKRVTLDAMIPREDFAVEGETFALDLFSAFPVDYLYRDSPILKLLRKPDFQRETNYWSPDQMATFVASFVDNEVIPSLILWKSQSYIFVIDGAHRLSALRAWIEDDYGDRTISTSFYGFDVSEDQKRVARRTRKIIEAKIAKFSTLKDLVGNTAATEEQKRRANLLFTRTLAVQWIQGNAAVAETSFFKINSQGTPLDETETLLIENRKKPIAISARAILRAGAGHKYWSAFPEQNRKRIEELGTQFYKLLFEPEISQPLKTIDVPLGGSVSPVDALALLIEFLTVAGTRIAGGRTISAYDDDMDGSETVSVLQNTLEVSKRITGNSSESLGLHPAVYFYNERGKYNRFLFLGIARLFVERLRNNDDGFWKKFTAARKKLEAFLVENKSLVGIILQNMNKKHRITKMSDLIAFLITEFNSGRDVTVEQAIQHLGLHGRIIDVVSVQASPRFTDNTKTTALIRQALTSALVCPVCEGKLDPSKSVSYDHIVPIRDGGTGDSVNCDLVHPYCNSGVKG